MELPRQGAGVKLETEEVEPASSWAEFKPVLWTLTEGAEASSPLPELQSPPLWKKHLAGSMTDWLALIAH